MRFQSLRLQQFNLLKDSGIQDITITFNENVQIIIGSNGSGKSVTLQQLSPFPSPRSLFAKTGFKTQVMEKDGHTYTLQSDYSKPSSPHLFLDGENEGENLNVGRTTGSQEELIVERLGITPLLDDLIMNRYRFPDWTPAKRKEFLMQVNPDQIGFVLVLAKQMSSKVKACKANLARLQSRRILLEADLLSPEDYALLEEEKAHVHRLLGDFQGHLMTLEVGLRTIGPVSLSTGDWLSTTARTLQRYQAQLRRLSHVDRRDAYREPDKETITNRLAVIEVQLSTTEEDQLKQTDTLMDLETRYRELDLGGDLQELDASIVRLETEKDRLAASRPAFDLSPHDLIKKYDELDYLTSQLNLFTGLTRKLLPNKRRQHRERMFYLAKDRQIRYRTRLNELEEYSKNLERQHKIKPRDIPEQPCAKERCPLYVQFFEQWEVTAQKRDRALLSIEKGTNKLERLDRYIEGIGDYLEDSKPFHDRIQWLLGQASGNPVLYSVLSRIDILTTLQMNPNRITRLLEDAYDQINVWHKAQALQEDLDTAYTLRQRQLSQASGSTVQLVKDIEVIKANLHNNRVALEQWSQEKNELTTALGDINRFNAIKSHVLILRETHLEYARTVGSYGERQALLFLKKKTEEIRQQHFSELGAIETRLRAQEVLKERLQEEVISQISLIEQEMSELQEIERALFEIPRENMARFINKVFKQANRLIDEVWSIPLAIELISDKNELTYEFMVTGDNQSERELSKCSLGQTDILSFSINLALRIVLGHLNYPLCLDEADAAMDEKHRRNFVVLLKRLVDEGVVSQLFLVSHQAIVHSSFANAETLVIRENNILLPPVYNQHVQLQ